MIMRGKIFLQQLNPGTGRVVYRRHDALTRIEYDAIHCHDIDVTKLMLDDTISQPQCPAPL
eukprot:scaffold10859_cov95-Skeletonema_dohrnii-CCMP3373.AAC.6